MEKKLVSIIVPVYNVEEYLSRAIESLLKQSYKNIEIILVDDGSKDNSGKICDEYAQKDKRINVIHKANGGLSSARNAGMKVMQGEYVCFVDSDDWVTEIFVQRLLESVEETNSDMGACLFYKTESVDVKSDDAQTEPKIITDKKFYCALIEESYAGYACNKIFKTSVIKDNELEFNENIFNGEDLPFVVKYLVYCNKTSFIEERLYYYYVRPNSITTSKGISQKSVTIITAREEVLETIRKYAPELEDIVLCAYLTHLVKIKYMSKYYRAEHNEFYKEICSKINKHKGKILSFKNISFKKKIKLIVMIYFSFIVGAVYRKVKGN